LDDIINLIFGLTRISDKFCGVDSFSIDGCREIREDGGVTGVAGVSDLASFAVGRISAGLSGVLAQVVVVTGAFAMGTLVVGTFVAGVFAL
jgi:hypothetical protein